MKRAPLISMLVFAASPVFAQRSVPANAPPSDSTTNAQPVFSFMGQTTETPMTMRDLNGNKCRPNGKPGQIVCSDSRRPALDGQPLKNLIMNFYNGKLFSVDGTFDNGNLLGLFDVLSARYGVPMKSKRPWESKSGLKVDNEIYTWHFKGGDLELRMLGLEVSEGLLTFSSAERLAR